MYQLWYGVPPPAAFSFTPIWDSATRSRVCVLTLPVSATGTAFCCDGCSAAMAAVPPRVAPAATLSPRAKVTMLDRL
jgi:hypothetical protein